MPTTSITQTCHQKQEFSPPPFGMQIQNRSYTNGDKGYRFAFNGKEKDSEGMGGGGSTYDYGFRIYNAQLGKFLSVDPLSSSYPWYTPFQFAGNTPIMAVDLDGLEEYYAADGSFLGAWGNDPTIRILRSDENINNFLTQFNESMEDPLDPDNVQQMQSWSSPEFSKAVSFKKLLRIQFKRGHPSRAMNTLIVSQNLHKISNNYIIVVANTPGAWATAGGEVSLNAVQTIRISKNNIKQLIRNYDRNPRYLNILGHELIHVFQRSEQVMKNHDEREFLAYHFNLLPENSPVIKDIQKYRPDFSVDELNLPKLDQIQQMELIDNAKRYYHKMSNESKEKYLSLFEEIQKLQNQLAIDGAYGSKEKKEAKKAQQ